MKAFFFSISGTAGDFKLTVGQVRALVAQIDRFKSIFK